MSFNMFTNAVQKDIRNPSSIVRHYKRVYLSKKSVKILFPGSNKSPTFPCVWRVTDTSIKGSSVIEGCSLAQGLERASPCSQHLYLTQLVLERALG